MMEVIRIILWVVVGAVAISATYSTIQYFRLYRPLMKHIRDTNKSENGEA